VLTAADQNTENRQSKSGREEHIIIEGLTFLSVKLSHAMEKATEQIFVLY
jgi:hypothetical protein